MGFAGMDLTCERVNGGTWAALSLQLCSTMCPFTTRGSKRASVLLSCSEDFNILRQKEKNKQTVVSLGLCHIRALSDRPSGQNPSVFYLM